MVHLKLEMDKDGYLVKNYYKIDKTEAHNNFFDSPKFTVKAQKSQRAGNNCKLPDPKSIPLKIHDRLNHRIEFPPLMIQNDHGEKNIEDIQSQDQDKE